MTVELEALQAAVQKNCHIADARHAGDFTLCVYLLKMREYYRWERGFAFDADLSREEVSDWLTEREQLWDRLEAESYAPLAVNGDRFDPFETDRINAALVPHGLVYSAGLGRGAKPHFFLGHLERHEQHDGFTVLVSAREYARDLSSPPAMTLGETIFIRRESLRRMIWEKVEEWRWSRLDNALGRAVASYDFDADLDAALEAMTTRELEAARLHEIGEAMAGRRLGPAWEELLASLPRSKTEFMLRAVRDHLADALSTLPTLIAEDNRPSLHFYMANLNGMRRELFPSLGEAYEAWRASGETAPLLELVERGTVHWEALAHDVLAAYAEAGTQPAGELSHLEGLMQARRL